MLAFLVSEVSLFSTLIVTYLSFMGQDRVGPTPREALSLPLVVATTICLLSSSLTVHLAGTKVGTSAFALWWSLTIALGIVFLLGTGYEWHDLIEKHHLTISRNQFGTTYYTLVGFHALHVTLGVVAMTAVLAFANAYRLDARHRAPVELVSWYWHFVDVVWIAVFIVVYLVSRSGA
jgi:cytochrome c oxidase subunit 3